MSYGLVENEKINAQSFWDKYLDNKGIGENNETKDHFIYLTEEEMDNFIYSSTKIIDNLLSELLF